MLGKTQMKRTAVAMALAACVGLVTLAAQRIVTSPPEPILKYLFPNAAAFSSLTGTPLHFKAYGADPKVDPNAPVVGLAFWTTDVVPEEQGYHGQIHIMVGMDMTGVLTRVFVDFNTEPYGYFSIEPPEFADQFTGKSIRAPFRVGQDVHAVSRATITISSATRAIRDSARILAKAYLDPTKVK
jgi:transcriptional regulator of nitric oxide reductase